MICEDFMPPKRETTRERVLDAALDIVRQQGIEEVSARSVAERLHCSTQPIYSLFASMEELKTCAYDRAMECAMDAIRQYDDDRYIPELRLAVGYFHLARQQKHLFRSVYLSDYCNHHPQMSRPVGEEMILTHAAKSARLQSLNEPAMKRIITKISIFITGLGAVLNAGIEDIPLEEAANLVTELYELLVHDEHRKLKAGE
jgi:AcrR family transcriptional regulator